MATQRAHDRTACAPANLQHRFSQEMRQSSDDLCNPMSCSMLFIYQNLQLLQSIKDSNTSPNHPQAISSHPPSPATPATPAFRSPQQLVEAEDLRTLQRVEAQELPRRFAQATRFRELLAEWNVGMVDMQYIYCYTYVSIHIIYTHMCTYSVCAVYYECMYVYMYMLYICVHVYVYICTRIIYNIMCGWTDGHTYACTYIYKVF